MTTRQPVPESSRRQVAVALQYDLEKSPAPQVLAKGWGHRAEEIRRLAEAHGVPMRRDDDLVQVLAKLDVGALIPPELYGAVAEILAFLYRTNQLAAQRAGR